jgi:hypothetical protein
VDAHLPITTDDCFTIDDPMLQLLIDRSVRWSLAQEIGSGPPAAGGRPAFVPAARAAMVAAGARDYMKNQVWREVNVKPPHPYLNHGTQGWSPTDRNNFFNGTPCDLYLSIHENAIHPNPLTAIGSENIVSMDANAPEAPPDDQIRLGKIFIKYVDPFDQGLRQEGVTQESSHVAMLHTGNTVRDKYTYFELEFMDVPDPANANVYRYEQMVDPAFIDRVARQIVNGIVEALLGPQIGFDSVKLRNVYTLW